MSGADLCRVLVVPRRRAHDAGNGPGAAYTIGGTERGIPRPQAERCARGVRINLDAHRFAVRVEPINATPGAAEEE